MEPSVFTKIINGEIPCHKVYEDELTFAFMDIHPIQPGTVVLTSKEQTPNYEDLSDNSTQAMALAQNKIMRVLRKVYPEKHKISALIEGLQTPHAHIVMFPFDTHDEFQAKQHVGEPDHDELEVIATKLRSNL